VQQLISEAQQADPEMAKQIEENPQAVKPMIAAVSVSAKDIADSKQRYGDELSTSASEAEAWITKPRDDDNSYEFRKRCVDKLKLDAKGDEDKFSASLLVFKDTLLMSHEKAEAYQYDVTVEKDGNDRAGYSVDPANLLIATVDDRENLRSLTVGHQIIAVNAGKISTYDDYCAATKDRKKFRLTLKAKAYIPKKVNGNEVVELVGRNMWKAVNVGKEPTHGIGYRSKPELAAKIEGHCFYWGTTVEGIDEGNGWLRVQQVPPVPGNELIELYFAAAFDTIDQEAFKKDVKKGLKDLGVKEDDLPSISVNLRAGSVIAEVWAPLRVIAEVKSLDVRKLTVQGYPAHVYDLPYTATAMDRKAYADEVEKAQKAAAEASEKLQ
jgi:hypothetical protein